MSMTANDIINIIGFFSDMIIHKSLNTIIIYNYDDDSDLIKLAMNTWKRKDNTITVGMVEFAKLLENWNYEYEISNKDNIVIINYIHKNYLETL
jgi:hypothetical protein